MECPLLGEVGAGVRGCKEYRLLMSRNLKPTQHGRELVLEEGRKKKGKKEKKESCKVFYTSFCFT